MLYSIYMRQPMIKFCRICGNPVVPVRREKKKAYYYPRQCHSCRNKPRNPEDWHKNMSNSKVGEHNPKYQPNGTRCITQCGKFTYYKIKTDDGWKYEHRIVMEKYLERKLNRDEVVHHINGNTLDNSIANLTVFPIGYHISNHLSGVPKSIEHRSNIKKNHWRNFS